MAEIVVTELRPADRERWAELWRGYLDFYETTLPEAIYDETWRRLMTPGPIFGFGARLGDAAAPLVGITHYLFHHHAWSRARLPAALLDNQGRQRHGPAALRPARQVQWLYPLRLRARLSSDGFRRRSTHCSTYRGRKRNPRPSYRAGKVKQAEQHMSRVRLGQTEQGSFVVTLLAPVPHSRVVGRAEASPSLAARARPGRRKDWVTFE